MQPAEFRFDLREASGALGDLGTLLPLILGTIAVIGLAPMPVVLGFGVAYTRPRSHTVCAGNVWNSHRAGMRPERNGWPR